MNKMMFTEARRLISSVLNNWNVLFLKILQQNSKCSYAELKELTEILRTKTYLFTATHTCTNQLFQGHL